MFKEFGQIAGMLKNLPKMREDMEKLQAQLAQVVAEGEAGAGMVKVKVNGHMEMVGCTLGEEALKGGDKELLEDLITAAVNAAMKKVKLQVAEETSKMAGALGLPGLPAGFNLPG